MKYLFRNMRLNHKEVKRRRLPELAGVIAALCTASVLPALAHYVYNDDRVYQATSECVEVRSEVSHGSYGGGYYKTDVEVWQDILGNLGNCIYHWERAAGNIAGMQQHYVYTQANGWHVCTATGWIFNTNFGNQLTIAVTHPSRIPVCGSNNTYANWTGGYHNNGGSWNGGWVWSGGHVL